ncbi:hypothetical protein DSM106972_018090 [Dulcicalothrix desertica PCC 7102]|uniref:Uncharacterized protein n=1 Tax=Dulcicalothrix desertica PCC 7102 TaxID=232991 RepID=A0A3S1ARQ8_9CYAN|nr:hypothetical protein DSM106972_018090 [Dulcicalothrix desertica PCC 7102]
MKIDIPLFWLVTYSFECVFMGKQRFVFDFKLNSYLLVHLIFYISVLINLGYESIETPNTG